MAAAGGGGANIHPENEEDEILDTLFKTTGGRDVLMELNITKKILHIDAYRKGADDFPEQDIDLNTLKMAQMYKDNEEHKFYLDGFFSTGDFEWGVFNNSPFYKISIQGNLININQTVDYITLTVTRYENVARDLKAHIAARGIPRDVFLNEFMVAVDEADYEKFFMYARDHIVEDLYYTEIYIPNVMYSAADKFSLKFFVGYVANTIMQVAEVKGLMKPYRVAAYIPPLGGAAAAGGGGGGQQGGRRGNKRSTTKRRAVTNKRRGNKRRTHKKRRMNK